MDKQTDELTEGKINAGRGVAKGRNSRSETESTPDENTVKDRPDDRARKAGY